MLFRSLYIYEHPHHNCPLCVLKGGHDFVGYLLYIPLFLGTAMSLSVASIAPLHKIPSLASVVPLEVHRRILYAIVLMLSFYVTAGAAILTSNLTMSGVWW